MNRQQPQLPGRDLMRHAAVYEGCDDSGVLGAHCDVAQPASATVVAL